VRIVEHEHYYQVEGVFNSEVVAGFTKPTLEGILPDDIYKALQPCKTKISLAYLNQLHSAQVCFVDKGGRYTGDALFTKRNNQALAVKTADCLPLFLASGNYTGIIHMGWRSAAKGILDNISCDLTEFKVTLGVGLRKCCYQVGEEFSHYQNLKLFLEERNSKLYFDPVSFAKHLLSSQGLKEDNFFDLNLCSLCHSKGREKNFFSYRRNKTGSRTLSFILKI
jgi:copper oxidase (laccase) domain-containing protein